MLTRCAFDCIRNFSHEAKSEMKDVRESLSVEAYSVRVMCISILVNCSLWKEFRESSSDHHLSFTKCTSPCMLVAFAVK